MKQALNLTLQRSPKWPKLIACLLVAILCLNTTQPLKAQNCHPLADFTFVISGCEVEFSPYSSGSGIMHFWTFQTTGAGLPSASNHETPIHSFGPDSAPFLRTVTHTVTIGGQIYTCTKEISVACTEGCTDRDFYYSVNGCMVSFGTLFGIVSLWQFGDGNSSTQTNPTHTYASTGDYVVTLTLASGETCRKTIRVQCDEDPPCCTAAFSASVTRTCSVLNLSLVAECNSAAGTHAWVISPNVPNACMELKNFFPNAPMQGMIQLTNINTCIVTQLIVTHRYICPQGGVLEQIQIVDISDEGIFIGVDGQNTLLTDYNCVLPGALYNGACTVYSSGIVTVDKDFTFSSANVRVHPGLSGFDVIKDFKLEQNTEVSGNSEPECNCLWRGIYVFSANMRTDTDASIKDALYAIRGMQKSKLFIRKTLFAKNFIGIRSTDGLFSLNQFEENRFDGQGPLKEICSLEPLNDVEVNSLGVSWCDVAVPYNSGSGFAGMYLKNAGNISLTPLPFSQQNRFYNLAVGIDASDTELWIVRNSRFENIVPSLSAYDVPFGGVAIRYVDTDNQGVNSFQMNGNGKFFAGSPDFDNCTFGIFLNSRVVAMANSGTRVGVINCRILGTHCGVFLSDNCGTGTFTGKRGFPRAGVGNNYIEVNPSTGDLYAESVARIAGISLTDFGPHRSAPEFWENTIDVNQDEPCGTYGIRCTAFNLFGQALDQVDVNRNQININEGAFGISLGNYVGAWVHDNSNVTFPGAGIFLNHQHLPLICTGSPGWNFSQGISVVGGYNNLVACNDVFSTPTGNRDLVVNSHRDGSFVQNKLDGGRYSAWFGLNCTGTRFACNTMSNYSENGLHYTNGVVTGPQGTPFTMTHGNVWVNTNPALTDAFINLGTVDPNASRYFVRNLPGENPTTNTLPNVWFTANVPNNIDPTCYYECPITAPPVFLSELTSGDSTVASGTADYIYFPEAAHWMGERNLLEKLAQNPSFTTGNVLMEAFVAEHQNTAMASLLEVSKQTSDLFALTEAQKNALESQAETITELMTQLYQLDSLYGAGLETGLALEENRAQRDSLAAVLDGLHAASDSLAHALTQQRLEGVPAVLAELEGIAPTNVYEWNERYVLKIYLRSLISGNDVSSSTKDSLYNIGRECPMVNGPSVYNARSLYEKFTGISLPEVDCPEVEERTFESQIRPIEASGILLYPNPAHDALTVKLPDHAEIGHYHLSITNVLGEVVVSTQIQSAEHRVPTGQLPNGAYFVRIVQNGTDVLATGIIIQH